MITAVTLLAACRITMATLAPNDWAPPIASTLREAFGDPPYWDGGVDGRVRLTIPVTPSLDEQP